MDDTALLWNAGLFGGRQGFFVERWGSFVENGALCWKMGLFGGEMGALLRRETGLVC